MDAFAGDNQRYCDMDNDDDCDAEGSFQFLDLFADGCYEHSAATSARVVGTLASGGVAMRMRTSRIAAASVLALSGALGVAIGQPDSAPSAQASKQQTDQEAVQAQVDALYAIISGPAGDRDWDRFRSLFVEGARLAQVFHRPDGTGGVSSLTPDEFAERSGAYLLENAFYETELSGRMEIYAGLAHVWSTYESRREPNAEPFTRGINSIQLVKAPGEDAWKILAVTWDSEASGIEIPAKYAGK